MMEGLTSISARMSACGEEDGRGGFRPLRGPPPAHPDAARVSVARVAAQAAHRAVRGGGCVGTVVCDASKKNPHRPDDGEGDQGDQGDDDAAMKASRVATAAKRAEPLLDMKQRTTHDDPEFMGTFFRASRLHYIGTWKHRYESFLEEEVPPAPPPLPPNDPSQRNGERLIMHVDMDCFFAAVAALGRPELDALPVAVSWSSAGAGELSSCNYVARAAGCKAGMRIASAKALCPNLVVMPYEFERYSAVALDVYRILHDVTPHVMGVSVDEAYVDVTGCAGTAEAIAARIRSKIREKTGCAASVGSGPNRLIARLATKKAKPDGACHVSAAAAAVFIAALPAEDLPGVGRGTLDKLKKIGGVGGGGGWCVNGASASSAIEGERTLTCADVAAAPLSLLQRALGPKSGAALLDAAKGVDRRPWEARPPRRSVGAQVTWGVRFVEAGEAVAFVGKLAAEVSERMRRLKTKGRTLTLKILRAVANAPEKYMKGSIGHGVCDHLTRSATLSSASDAAGTSLSSLRLKKRV